MELAIVRTRNILADRKLKWDNIESYPDKIISLNQTLGHKCFDRVQMNPNEKPGILKPVYLL